MTINELYSIMNPTQFTSFYPYVTEAANAKPGMNITPLPKETENGFLRIGIRQNVLEDISLRIGISNEYNEIHLEDEFTHEHVLSREYVSSYHSFAVSSEDNPIPEPSLLLLFAISVGVIAKRIRRI